MRKKKREENKLLYASMIIIIVLSLSGYIQGGWVDQVTFISTFKMGCWTPCIQIMKSLDGTYSDPVTGEFLSTPNRTHIAIAANFSSLFKLTICVKNCGSITLNNVIVTDTVKNNVGPVSYTVDKGTVSWYNYSKGGTTWDGIHFGFNELTWNIGALTAGEKVCLEIWIGTLQNPADKYEPTSGDDGDGQDIEINEGATVTATSPYGTLLTTTEEITITVEDDGIQENGIGVIVTILPYETPWAEDKP